MRFQQKTTSGDRKRFGISTNRRECIRLPGGSRTSLAGSAQDAFSAENDVWRPETNTERHFTSSQEIMSYWSAIIGKSGGGA